MCDEKTNVCEPLLTHRNVLKASKPGKYTAPEAGPTKGGGFPTSHRREVMTEEERVGGSAELAGEVPAGLVRDPAVGHVLPCLLAKAALAP